MRIAIIKDLVGNTLHEGHLVYWKQTGLLLKVLEINAGGITTPGGKETVGTLTLELKLPFDPTKPLTCFNDFVRIYNPDEDPARAAEELRMIKVGES